MSTANTQGALVFERVTKQYGKVVAVNDVSFSIPQGTLVTLLGPSGCGKTSTLRLIAGLEHVSQGRIFIGGQVVLKPMLQRARDAVGSIGQVLFEQTTQMPFAYVCGGVPGGVQQVRQSDSLFRQVLPAGHEGLYDPET